MLLAKAKNPKKSHSSLGNEVKQKLTMHGTIREDSTVNRYVTCLRHMFTKAVEWEMVEQSQFDRGKTLHIEENNQRMRLIACLTNAIRLSEILWSVL